MVSFSFQQLLTAILIIAAIAALVILSLVLVRLYNTVGKINKVIEDSAQPLNDTITALPAMSQKIDKSLDNVQSITDTANQVVSDTGDLIDKVIKGPGDSFAEYLQIISSILVFIKSLMNNKPEK